MRAVIVTNIPTPYRIPVYERVDAEPDIDLSVVYMAEREANRSWVLPRTDVRSVFLRARVVRLGGRFVHVTTGTWRALKRLRPEVVVTTGFNPPQLAAFAYAVRHGIPHVVQTDGTVESEASLSVLHRVIRRIVGRRSGAFVACAGRSSERLVRQWGPAGAPVFRSPLTVDVDAFERAAALGVPRDVDLLFSGRLSQVKDPLFAIEVAAAAAERLGERLRLAILGDGPLLDQVRAAAERHADTLDVLLPGFQQQQELPGWYARSRVFLFPTHWDPWGLVLNEALAAGVPAIVSPAAGSARELLADSAAGRVLPLDVDAWAAVAADLLFDGPSLNALRPTAQEAVAGHTFAVAARGIADALRSVTRSGGAGARAQVAEGGVGTPRRALARALRATWARSN